jgi:hypothetical protein
MSDSEPTNNPKAQMSPRLTYQYGVFREIERAEEYPVEADGSQTISEFCREYTHIVDDLKNWPYFDIPGCLKRLSWSLDECYGRIGPQWIRNSSLTRHAVVQLALYTCPSFRNIRPAGDIRSSVTEGDIVDQLESGNEKEYLCPSVMSLVEALATALMQYEVRCERIDTWQRFQTQRDSAITLLEDFLWLWENARRHGFPPKDSELSHKKKLPADIQKVIRALTDQSINI